MDTDRKEIVAGAVAGVIVGGAVTVFLAMRKARDLQVKGALLQAALEHEGGNVQLVLAAYGEGMEPRLAAYAEQYATEHLANAYGLTESRLAALPRLFARYGIT